MSAFGASPIFNQASTQQRLDSFNIASATNAGNTWAGTPPSSLPFGQGPMSPGAWGPPSGGWPSSTTPALPGLGPIGSAPSLGSLGRSRPLQIRISAVNFFRSLPAGSRQDLGTVTRAVSQTVNPPPTAEELINIHDTEGNENNGGGSFAYSVNAFNPEQSVVRFEVLPSGPGAIGSPNVSASGVHLGGVAPGLFPNLGSHAAQQF